MQWDRCDDVIQLTRGIETSFYSSLKYLGGEFPKGTLKLKPSFLTHSVIDACAERYSSSREKVFEDKGPKLSVDIHPGNRVEVSLYALYENQQLLLIDRWILMEVNEYKKSVEDFLRYIAENCHKIVNVHSKMFDTIGRPVINCGLVFGQPVNQMSLTDSVLTNWELQVAECANEIKDFARLFDDALNLHESKFRATINCTHVVNDCVSALAGMNIRYKDRRPDIMVSMSQGQNICFFYDQHKIPGFEGQPMIINSEISHLGGFVGSCDHELLCGFLTPITDALKTIHKHDQYLLPKLTTGYHISETIRTFINQECPEMQKMFKWLKIESTISESDISNFLEFVNTKTSKPSKLTAIYMQIGKHKQRDLSELCSVLVKRSASLMAAITLGFVRVFCYVNRPTDSVTVGLDGSLMKEMFQYRQKFTETIKELQQEAAKSNDLEPVTVEISFADSTDGDSDLCNILLGEHIADCSRYE